MNNTFKQRTTLHQGYDGKQFTSILKVQLQLEQYHLVNKHTQNNMINKWSEW